MTLTLTELRELAAAAARELDPALEVLGATVVEGGQSYVEIVAALTRAKAEPRQFVIGISRELGQQEIRESVRTQLREQVERLRDS